jgi:hypothetical protein
MATYGGPEGLLTAAIFDWHKLDAPNLIDPTGDVALGGGNGYLRPRPGISLRLAKLQADPLCDPNSVCASSAIAHICR